MVRSRIGDGGPTVATSEVIGSPGWTRTNDLRINSPPL